MPERFTGRARRVAGLAQDEPRMPGHEHIDTEHILLCLIREDQGLAAPIPGGQRAAPPP
jgi:ATP-dependent Clp protease ATP-binding subunit ClpC